MRINGCCYHWTDALALAEQLDDVLANLGQVEKARANPLTPKGFDDWANRFAARVIRAAKTGDNRAVKAMVSALEQPWTKLTSAQRDRLIAQATSKLALKASEQVHVLKTAGNEMKFLVIATKKGAKSMHELKGVQTVFDAQDAAIVKHTRTSQAHYIRDAYGRRREALSKTARKVVAEGVEAGFDSATIGEMLASRMSSAGILRAQSYWTTVSSIFAARARSYALARSFDEANIQYAKISAVLDERTTEQCYFLEGKVIPVGKVLDRYKEVADSDDPEAVAELQPFLQLGKSDSGDEVIYYKDPSGSRVVVAEVEQAARGTRDGAGRYKQRIGDRDLVDAGVGFPPYHPLCRTTTTPL